MSNNLLTGSYAALFFIWGISYFYAIPVSVNVIITSTILIYIGAHRSLRLLIDEVDGGAPSKDKDIMTTSDALKFPFVGSAALFSLYIAFKYFDKDTVNLILGVYILMISVITVSGTFAPFLSQFIPGTKKYGFKTKLPYLGDIDAMFNFPEIVSLILAIGFSVTYFFTKHYMLNNVLGISFCVQSIEKISVGSYKIGAILLTGLFFYDIFWVFGTDVMVTVAKSFDAPIKLLFPIILPTLEDKGKFSLLGLGDIVMPGVFIALLLRFDAVKNKIDPKIAEYASFNKIYFHVNILAYAFGLSVTLFVMYFFRAAQPALLYLSPACIFASLLVGLYRSELGSLFAYDEENKDKKEVTVADKKEQ